MLVRERERVEYDERYDYRTRDDRRARYDYENRYEEDRLRTSSSYRESLMESLERPASRSRLERSDEARYGFYMNTIKAGENNYDKLWDRKHAQEKKAPVQRRSNRTFIVAYMVIALIAVLAVSISVIGLGDSKTVVKKNLGEVSATAEGAEKVVAGGTAASESTETPVLSGGEHYVMLANGELISVEIPKETQQAKEKETGFDKFCDWWNGVLGG